MHLFRRFSLSALLLFTMSVLFSCRMFSEREVEGNDTLETAMPVQSGKPVKAMLVVDGDLDFYRIEETQRSVKGWNELVNEGKDIIVQISIVHDQNLSPMIKIYQGTRVIKVVDDPPQYDSGASEAGFVNALFTMEEVQTGRAIFSIEQGSWGRDDLLEAERNYTLNVEIRSFQEDEEREPNDKPVQATSFGARTLMHGFYDPARGGLRNNGNEREEDWYSFEIPESNERKILHFSISAVPNVDARLSLYDELGYLVRESNSNGVGEIEKLMSIGLVRGHYFIKVESAEYPQKNPKVGYLLKIEQSDVQHSEYEPNDRYIFANEVYFAQDTYGYFNPVGDIDWFRISIYEPEPQIISIKISPTEDIDSVIEFHGQGEQLLSRADDRGIDEGEIIKNMGAEEGIYFIKVYNRNPERDNPENRYTLLVEKQPWQEDEEFEVNDTLEQANSTVLNGLKRGFISPKADRDYYAFTVPRDSAGSQEPVEVTFELSPCVLIDLAMHVYNERGEFLEEINNNPAEEGEREALYLYAGRYFVEVFSMNDFENARDAYTLRVY